MKNKILNTILVSLLVFGFTACEDTKDTVEKISTEKKDKLPKPEWEDRLTNYKDTGKWFQLADNDEKAAYNIGNTYRQKIKDNKKAIEWYLYSDSIKYNSSNLLNLANTYEDLEQYENAIKYMKLSFKLGEDDATYNLALLYQDILNDLKNAEIWYKKGIERESIPSLKGIISLYYEKKDYIKTSAYMINLIAYSNFTKEEVINRLKNHYKFDNETIKKGYELQLKMEGLPRRFTGDLNLD